MFRCWKCYISDPVLVGFIIFIGLFWSLMREMRDNPFLESSFSYKSRRCARVSELQSKKENKGRCA